MEQINLPGGGAYFESWADYKALVAKMHRLAGMLGKVERDGENKFHKYSYTSYESLAAIVRGHLKEAGLLFSVGATGVELLTRGDSAGRLMNLELRFTDAETGATWYVYGYGEGEDKGDKGAAKALTAGVKYFLMRNFLISSEDDVDSDADGPTKTRPKTQPKAESPKTESGHWASDAAQAQEFMAAARAHYAKSNAEILKGLGIGQLSDWAGTKKMARDALDTYFLKQLEGAA